jgi:AcrR family transcriptional regulator
METRTDEEIIQATYRTLCKHGYADLTIQRIADESSLTSAAIHYHFNTKQELLDAFLQHMIDRLEQRLPDEDMEPGERLAAFLDAVFTPPDTHEDDFPVALMELKAQAPFQEVYRHRFEELDRTMRAIVAATVRDGVAAGAFDDADPETVARFVVTSIEGGHARRVALGEGPTETRRMVETYLEHQLGWTPEVRA